VQLNEHREILIRSIHQLKHRLGTQDIFEDYKEDISEDVIKFEG
jgi:hypothetical protein